MCVFGSCTRDPYSSLGLSHSHSVRLTLLVVDLSRATKMAFRIPPDMSERKSVSYMYFAAQNNADDAAANSQEDSFWMRTM